MYVRQITRTDRAVCFPWQVNGKKPLLLERFEPFMAVESPVESSGAQNEDDTLQGNNRQESQGLHDARSPAPTCFPVGLTNLLV